MAFLAKTNGILEQINSFAKTENSSQVNGAPQEKKRPRKWNNFWFDEKK